MFQGTPYQLYEMAHAALVPARAVSDATHFIFRNPWNPLANTALGKNISAGAELFERMTRRYGKPTFGLTEFEIDGMVHPVLEDVVWTRPFCNLRRFVRPDSPDGAIQPKLLIVAPMSGHYATLLRGTVEAFLPHFDVYITDWADARMMPLAVGFFDLDDYIDDSARDSRRSRPRRPHPWSLPACRAAACGGSADGGQRRYFCARQHDLDGWPDRHATQPDRSQQTRREARRRMVAAELPALGSISLSRLRPASLSRFLQLSGFMAMNLGRHVTAHLDMFNHLVAGDGDFGRKASRVL